MQFILSFFFVTMCWIAMHGQQANSGYDSLLARKIGADDYGMKRYVMVILSTGESKIQDSLEIQRAFAGHMRNMSVLADAGRLVLAGPMMPNAMKYRGIFVMNTGDVNEARRWVNTDPAVAAGLLKPDYFNWYGSAALMLMDSLHRRVQRFSVMNAGE